MDKQIEMVGVKFLSVRESCYKYGMEEARNELRGIRLEVELQDRQVDGQIDRQIDVCACIFQISKLKLPRNNVMPVAMNIPTTQIFLILFLKVV